MITAVGCVRRTQDGVMVKSISAMEPVRSTIAKTLQEHHVDFLAVAVADEGSELRKAGITASIIIMNPEMTAFKTMFDYKLEPETVISFTLSILIKRRRRRESLTSRFI